MKMGVTEKLFRKCAGEKRFAPGAGPGAADDVALGSCGDDVEHGREDVPARRKDLRNKFDTLLPALPFEVLDLALQKFGRDGAVPDVNQRQCPIGGMGGEPDGVPGDPVAVEGTVVSEVEHLPPLAGRNRRMVLKTFLIITNIEISTFFSVKCDRRRMNAHDLER
jgi:hypothetical protein